jgi:hypothetical protein
LKIFLLAIVFEAIHEAKAKEIACEAISLGNYGGIVLSTCKLERTTSIDSTGVSISDPKESILGLYFFDNKKIHYLPENLQEHFSNLSGIQASKCAIKQISNVNFKGLTKLTFVELGDNKIEKIASNTFEDSLLLEKLYLCKNPTTTFESLQSLTLFSFKPTTKSNS